MLDFNGNDNLQVQGLAQQIKSTPGFDKINQDMVSKAWDFSKTKAQSDGVNATDPQYWDMVSNQTKQALGMQLPNTPKDGQPFDMQANHPLDPQQTVANPKSMNNTVVEAYSGRPGGKGPYRPGAGPKKGPRESEETTDEDRAYNADLDRRRRDQAQVKRAPKKEAQMSGAFSSTVPENAVVPNAHGKTGPQINSEAQARLDLMKKHGFGTQLA